MLTHVLRNIETLAVLREAKYLLRELVDKADDLFDEAALQETDTLECIEAVLARIMAITDEKGHTPMTRMIENHNEKHVMTTVHEVVTLAAGDRIRFVKNDGGEILAVAAEDTAREGCRGCVLHGLECESLRCDIHNIILRKAGENAEP